MRVKLKPHVRQKIYVVASVASLAVTYLATKEIIGVAEVGLWSGVMTLVTAMAGVNVSGVVNKER